METGGTDGHTLSRLAGKRPDSVNSGRAAARTLAKAPEVVNARGGTKFLFFLKNLAPDGQASPNLCPLLAHPSIVHLFRQMAGTVAVAELGGRALEGESHGADRAVSLLGDDDL